MRLIIFVFGLFFSSVILQGQQAELEPLGAPHGADIRDFNINKDGEILVFQNHVGLLFSEGSGQTWTEINSSFNPNTFIREILPHPNGDFYILPSNTFDKIFIFDRQKFSIDFIEIDSLGSLVDLIIDSSGTIYFLTREGNIFSSADNGNTWILLASLNSSFTYSSNILSLSFYEESIYVHDRGNGILEIPLNGSPIDPINFTGSIFSQITEVQPGVLWGGTTQGLYQIDKNLGFSRAIGNACWNVWDILTTPNGNIIIETTDGYFSTNDFGANFSKINIDIPNISNRNYLTGRIVYDSTSNSVFFKNENGFNSNFLKSNPDFSSIQQIIPSSQPIKIESILKIDDDVIILNKRGEYGTDCYISYDDGSSFSPLLINGNGVFDLEIGGNSTVYALCEDRKIYRSTDKCISWQNIHPQGNQYALLSQSFVKAGPENYIYCMLKSETEDGCSTELKEFYSKDAGDNWLEISNNIPTGNEKALTSFDIYGNFYYGQLSPKISKFSDKTQTWEVIYEDSDNFDFLFWLEAQDSLNFLATGFRGTDIFNINTNNAFSSRVLNQLPYDISNPIVSVGYYPKLIKSRFLLDANGSEILLSQNDGLSWEQKFLRDTITHPNGFSAFHIDDENYLYVAFSGDLLHKSTTPLQFNSNSIQGKVQIDENDNCLNDPIEAGIPNIIVTAAGQDTFFVSTQADGSFDILVPEGTYDVYTTVDTPLWQVCTPLQTVSLVGIYDTAFVDFSVDAQIDCPKLEVDLTTPRLLRCFDNTYYVRYGNEGTISTDTPFVKITLDTRFDITQASIPFTTLNDSCYIFPLDTLRPFEYSDFSFTTEMDCDQVALGETVCAEAHIFPDSICAPPSGNWSGASLETTAECIGDSIIFKIKNVGNGNMDQARQYIIIEDVVIMRVSPSFNLPAGDSLRIPIDATGQTYHLGVPQVDNHPGYSYPSITVESCGMMPHSLGLFNQFSQNDNNPFVDVECREVVGSYDPNDKAAVPIGIDVEHKIQPNSSIEYLIRFQNTGSDTAFSINIIDTLSNWLDVTSFQAGASSHDYEYEISDKGTVRFLFNNIMLPDSNINQAASNGFVKYKIAMKTDLSIGTRILNKADIYFDFNKPIVTNETFHVIDEPWILVKTSEVFEPGVEVNAYPNPFQHQATIKLSNAMSGRKKFRLFDLSGRQMRQQYFDSDQFTFEKQNLPNGVYFYEIAREGTKIAVGKLIVQ